MRTRDEVLAVLSRVTFAPSCVDMGWEWEVVEVHTGAGVLGTPMGFLIQTTFQRPDRDTGEIQRGTGGWHHVPADGSDTAIVKRAYVAAKAILEHEVMESFHYDGDRLFDPHHDIDDLRKAVDRRSAR